MSARRVVAAALVVVAVVAVAWLVWAVSIGAFGCTPPPGSACA